MYTFEQTVLEGKQGSYEAMRNFFEEEGYELGGGWEYDHGYFDKQLELNPGYLFIRVPAYVEKGTLGDPGATIRLGRPFLLRHQYQSGIDEDAEPTLTNAMTNQFSEPQDADASLEQEDVDQAKPLIQQLEQAFQQRFGS